MVAEVDISKTVCSYYRSKGLDVKTEVPLLSKRVDIVAYSADFKTMILVETKVRDWKAALRQATVYTLCTPDVYIAIAKKYSHRVDIGLVRKLGVGFLEVDGNVTSRLEPLGNATPQPSVRKLVIRSIDTSRGGDS